jgi:hypothetical protein
MPATPGTSTTVEIDPAIGLVSSDTQDPFVGIEAGRTYVASTPTTKGAAGTDTIKAK